MCARKAGVTKIGDSARARQQDCSGQTAEKGRVAGPQTLSQARGPGGRHPGRYVPALSALADGSRFCLFNPQLSSPYVGVRGFLARGYFILGRDGGGAWWPGKVPCRRRGRRATGPGLGQTTVLFVSLMLHMLDPYSPLFSNTFEMLDFCILVRFS